MLTLPYPTPGNFQYPMKGFTGISNLRRIVNFNQKSFRDYLDLNPFNLENQHPLVGLLQQLTIDPAWDLDYVIKWTQFKAYSLCTLFNINSMSGVGGVVKNGVYGRGCVELWGLIENDKVYDSTTLRFENLRPVVPIYSTIIERGYKLILETTSSTDTRYKDNVALVGINLVELAIGWWMWMNDETKQGTGIHHYLCMWPLYTATLIHNQGVTVNWLYEFFVKGKSTSGMFDVEQVKFTTLSESKLLKEWFVFKADFLTSRTLVNIGHLIKSIDTLSNGNYFNYEDGGNAKYFVQTSWFWQPAVIKWYSVYMTLFNIMNAPDKQLKPTVQRILPFVTKGFDKCPSTFCRTHFKGITLELSELTK